MFEPQKDRVDYGKLLTPPDGFELDFAVGTTYSLDFDAFIGACMSLGLSEDTESALLNDPIFMLDVLHKTSDKIALFCEGGQIHSPVKITPLYALLENSVQQVLIKGNGKTYPSFHPKFWLISYKNKKGEKQYRFIVLSRNLTFDRSWDVVFAMDGRKGKELVSKNQPVKDFLDFLKGYLPKTAGGKQKSKRIQELISELDYIEFKTEDKAFEDFDFIPLGIGEYSIRNYPLFDKDQYYELLVMSPFLSKSTVKELNGRWKKSTVKPALFTRRQSLVGYTENECRNFDVYCMRSDVVDGEEDDNELSKQDIHAKLYMLRESFYADAQVYLGSMNASHIATNDNSSSVRNIEFMVRLTCKKRSLNLAMLNTLKNEFFCGEEGGPQNPFEKVDINAIQNETEEDENLNGIIKAICRSKATARVEQDGERFNVSLDIKCKEQSYPVSICPLFAHKTQALSCNVIFTELALKELSQFYKIAVTGKEKMVERIIVIPTSGIPENRDEAVISSIVPDTKSFYAYLSFVLGDNPVLGAMEAFRILRSGNEGGRITGSEYSAALYEKMLKVAATNPEKLNSIDYLMKAVSKDGIVPDKFIKLYSAFQKAVKR